MELFAFVLGFVVLGALALRFGQGGREGFRSVEHRLADRGMTWTDLATDGAAPTAVAPAPGAARPLTTLALIERACGAAPGTLTASADAERLEKRARELAAEFWSDRVWTTGIVPEAGFRRVLAEIAPALLDAPIPTAARPVATATLTEAEERPESAGPAPATDDVARIAGRQPVLGLAGSTAIA